jgi:hypothetical protein
MKRIVKTGDEQDVYSRWRHILCSYQRAGAVKKVKKRTHRRERREAKQYIQEQMED